MERGERMSTLTNLFEALSQERAILLDALKSVPDALLDQKGVVGEWSIKNVLAHLTSWESVVTHFLPERLASASDPKSCQLSLPTKMHGMHSKWHHASGSHRKGNWTNSNKLGRHSSRFSPMSARKHSIGSTPGPNGREHWQLMCLKRLEDMNVSTVKPCLLQPNDAEVH